MAKSKKHHEKKESHDSQEPSHEKAHEHTHHEKHEEKPAADHKAEHAHDEHKADAPKEDKSEPKVSHVSRAPPAQSSGTNPWLIASIVLAILLIGSLLTSGYSEWNGPEWNMGFGAANQKSSKEFSLDGAYAEGVKNAPVTIIEYSDFQCPYCERFYTDTLPQIRENYIKTGKVKLVYKNFPLSFHQNAEHAAEAAQCAGDQGAFFAYHDKLFGNQNAWVNLADPTSKFVSFATDLGLDESEFKQCYTSGKHASDVQADFNEGSQAGVRGTPSFFINGQLVSGAQPYSVFKAAIDQALSGNSTGSTGSTPPTPPTQTAPTSPKRVSINLSGQYVRGSDPSAGVTLVEYSDYQCPYCERWYSQVEPSLTTNYLDTGKVRMIYKEFPLSTIHPNAENGANAAQCAGAQGKYWQMHDALFGNQSSWSAMSDPTNTLVGYASDLGLDSAAFKTCLTGKTYQSRIDAEQAEGAAAGVSGTPTSFVLAPKDQVDEQTLIAAQQSDGNGGYYIRYVDTAGGLEGLMIVGAQPYSVFNQALQALGVQ